MRQTNASTKNDGDPELVLRAVVDANAYMTLATADADGRPWASPVWFAHEGYGEFFWVSRPDTRHSRNLVTRPSVAIVIFDSTRGRRVGSGLRRGHDRRIAVPLDR
jgi:nitroimidazol reductase NimA-like FMN-containing flavoprotein (pyridoxamine 5'-phosphate oxidase superfamily)